MLCCVLVFRAVTTTDVTAGKAHSKMDPRIARFQALLAAVCFWRHVSNLVQVSARV